MRNPLELLLSLARGKNKVAVDSPSSLYEFIALIELTISESTAYFNFCYVENSLVEKD